jgi:hypothetical protein
VTGCLCISLRFIHPLEYTVKPFFTSIILVLLSLTTINAATIDGIMTNVDGDGAVDDLSISQIHVTVSAGTTVAFDSLVWESTGVDINGDGYVTGFDNYMRLFTSANAHLGTWDDYDTSGPLNQNGSVHIFDTAFEYIFTNAGDYWVSVGPFTHSSSEAIQGFDQDRNYSDYTGQGQTWGAWRLDLTASNGTISNLSVINGGAVPEAHEWALIILAAIGCYVAFRIASARGTWAVSA